MVYKQRKSTSKSSKKHRMNRTTMRELAFKLLYSLEIQKESNKKEQIETYKKKKYRICMYQSGNDDIKINLLKLILNNA